MSPKAILGPIPGRVDLDAAMAEGWLTPGNGRAIARIRRGRSGRRVNDVLTEDRET